MLVAPTAKAMGCVCYGYYGCCRFMCVTSTCSLRLHILIVIEFREYTKDKFVSHEDDLYSL